jgi:hypothetical protein
VSRHIDWRHAGVIVVALMGWTAIVWLLHLHGTLLWILSMVAGMLSYTMWPVIRYD